MARALCNGDTLWNADAATNKLAANIFIIDIVPPPARRESGVLLDGLDVHPAQNNFMITM